ncbi:hypothetical protein BV98_001771 [Sphingobium herbicidovorans NBRC 16415]|uniref:Uncharacterized protein n=1 Tax=Sphingobium herbicidovorans (strain ATCC 700291 / DSM 11019 / CCUG 56400 / KCTC 2939 / LMG 18315 / NBRC 16415 / MH) TaxID=1219045 RepID=A0A086PAZ9_SPHHM|nr:hypothetical protein [Sphingobium herbicidovorans]KFG90567.1 hypothetical protein BV98_001771 [Sphingobium herbicidovorans NBRC 16415]
MSTLLAALYLLLMAALGWRLFLMAWSRALKIAVAATLILPIPALFLLPALMHPDRPFADLLGLIGAALAISGVAALLLGMAGAWLKARRT